MQPRSDPERRPIVANSEHPAIRLDPDVAHYRATKALVTVASRK